MSLQLFKRQSKASYSEDEPQTQASGLDLSHSFGDEYFSPRLLDKIQNKMFEFKARTFMLVMLVLHQCHSYFTIFGYLPLWPSSQPPLSSISLALLWSAWPWEAANNSINISYSTLPLFVTMQKFLVNLFVCILHSGLQSM